MDCRSKLLKSFLETKSVSTDSRQIKPGTIYFALKGQRFDGNLFTEQALVDGAILAVTDDPAKKELTNHIYVPDVLLSLQQLASDYRDTFSTPVIGITGSNGKTTTKELIVAVLSMKYQVSFTKGNLNNHIGVPLTLLSVKGDEDFVVVEMGANYPDEIAHLCTISKPDIGIITSIGKAHLEGFGSLEVIARTKSGLFEAVMKRNGVLFYHENDYPHVVPYIREYANCVQIQAHSISLNNKVYSFELLEDLPSIRYRVSKGEEIHEGLSPLPGLYNFNNIKLAIALGIYLDVPCDSILTGISKYTPGNNRSQWKQWGIHRIFLDAYNANPTSMELAIQTFGRLPGNNKVLVLGGMKELGPESDAEHLHLVQQIEFLDFKQVFLIGDEFKRSLDSKNSYIALVGKEEVRNWLLKHAEPMMVFVKGSRAYALESIIE